VRPQHASAPFSEGEAVMFSYEWRSKNKFAQKPWFVL
jgi:hypothetical protein